MRTKASLVLCRAKAPLLWLLCCEIFDQPERGLTLLAAKYLVWRPTTNTDIHKVHANMHNNPISPPSDVRIMKREQSMFVAACVALTTKHKAQNMNVR